MFCYVMLNIPFSYEIYLIITLLLATSYMLNGKS